MKLPVLVLLVAMAWAACPNDGLAQVGFDPEAVNQLRTEAVFETRAGLEEGGSFEISQARLSTPLYGRRFENGWMVALRAGAEFTQLETSADLLEEDNFHRIQGGAFLLYKPEDSPWRLFAAGAMGLATDWSDVNAEDLVYALILAGGYEFSDRLTLIVGGYYSQDFGDATLFPGAGFLWKVSDQWTVALLPPRLRIGYAPSEKWRFALEGYPDGGSWSVATAEGRQASLERSVIRAGVRVERQMVKNAWLYVSGGWAFDRELRIEDEESGRELFDSDADSGASISMGLSFSF